MNHFNMITGEPESPPNRDSFSMTEQEVVGNANLLGTFQNGGYYYDTNTRMIQAQQSGFSNYMNPPGSSVGNPAFAAIEAMKNGTLQSPYYQAPATQDQVYTIPGFNPGGSDLLLPEGIEDIKKKLQLEMMTEQDLAYEKKLQKQQEFYRRTGYNTNYYGMPYISYDDPAIYAKYRQIVEGIMQEAMNARQSLNKRLSTFAHNYVYGSCDEEEISQIYDTRTVVVPAVEVEQNNHQTFLESLQETECNAEKYQEAYKRVSDEHNRYFEKYDKIDLNAFLEGATYMHLDDLLNEEQQRRRDLTGLYQQSGNYRSLIKASLIERKRRENGDFEESTIHQSNPFQLPSININDFPTLVQSGTIMDDGTITISPPDSIYTPSMNPATIMNENESKYQVSREKFKAAIFGDDPLPGGVG